MRWFLVTCPLLLRSSHLGASWGRSCISQSQPPSVPPLKQAHGSTYSRPLVEPKAQRWRSLWCFQAVNTPLTFYSLLQHCQPVGDLRLQLVDAECSVKWSQMIESKKFVIKNLIRSFLPADHYHSSGTQLVCIKITWGKKLLTKNVLEKVPNNVAALFPLPGKTYLRLPLLNLYKLHLVCVCIFYFENLKKLTQDCKKMTKNTKVSVGQLYTLPHMLSIRYITLK